MVAGVARLERDLAAHGRNADAVAVPGDAGDHALEQTPGRTSAPRESPNLSEFISAMGLAPIVKMSRMMPPTPVAAPW